MNWKRVKNFLILILIAVDLLLYHFAYDYYTQKDFTDEKTAVSASRVLETGGITVAPSLLTVQSERAAIYTCAYLRDDYLCLTAAALLGGEADGIYLVPEGIRAETEAGGVAYLSGDLSLLFTAPGIEPDRMRALLQDGVAVADADAEKRLLETLLGLGRDSLAGAQALSSGGHVFISVSQELGGVQLAGMYCTFGFSDGSLVYAEGRYFFAPVAYPTEAQLLDRINILFSEKKRGKTGDVDDISLCYVLYEYAEDGSMLLYPAYRVQYTDGSISVVNGATGEKYG